MTAPELSASQFGERDLASAYLSEVVIFEFLEVEERVVRTRGRAKQFIKLDLDGLRVPVLGVLDEKYPEKRHSGCTGIDHHLPRIIETKELAPE